MTDPIKPTPGRVFALALGLTALIAPLAVHLFFPVIPVVKGALGISYALTTAIASTSTRKSGCDSRRTSTAVLVDKSSPQNSIRASICSK